MKLLIVKSSSLSSFISFVPNYPPHIFECYSMKTTSPILGIWVLPLEVEPTSWCYKTPKLVVSSHPILCNLIFSFWYPILRPGRSRRFPLRRNIEREWDSGPGLTVSGYTSFNRKRFSWKVMSDSYIWDKRFWAIKRMHRTEPRNHPFYCLVDVPFIYLFISGQKVIRRIWKVGFDNKCRKKLFTWAVDQKLKI